MQAKIKKGFTILEILLVITLLSILFGILLATLRPTSILSDINDNKRESDALVIYQALEQYALKNNSYPEAIKNLANSGSIYICKTNAPSCNSSSQINLSTNILVPTYMSKIPEYSTDANNSGFYVVKDSNGRIGIGGVKQVNSTTFVKGLESQSFSTVPTSPIVTNGLVLNLDAGNPTSYPGTGTTWTDLSGNNNNGTLVNGVGYNSANGGSLAFDGVNDHILTSNISHNIGSNDFTYSLWVYPTSLKVAGATIVGFIGNGEYSPVFGFDPNGFSSQLGYYWGTWRGFGTTLQLNQWYHVVMTRQASEIKGFVNAVLCPTTWTGQNQNMTNSSNVIGRSGVIYTPDIFKGNISNIQIYNRALTPSEIQQNFNATKDRFGL